MEKRIKVALVGLAFGASFAEIYKCHPNVSEVALFDADREVERRVGERCGIPAGRYASFEALLADPTIDAVHLVTPIPLHEEQTVAALRAGKHCACTVPMATSLEGLGRICQAQRESGKRYMMMETTLYTYQFFYVRQMIASGRLGRIQFLRGSHYQDMQAWPDYWMGLPPMHYATHAIGPLVALSGSRVERVVCFGSGTMDPALAARYGNPYPVESALLRFENGLKAEATRSLFETARQYQEGLFVYGSRASFEWGFADGDDPIVTELDPPAPGKRGGTCRVAPTPMPNCCDGLPEPIRRFTVGERYDPLNPQESLKAGAGAGHHGSHPHLVNEFVRSVVEDRAPWIDHTLGANITAAGVCAHQSAMADGEPVVVPRF